MPGWVITVPSTFGVNQGVITDIDALGMDPGCVIAGLGSFVVDPGWVLPL